MLEILPGHLKVQRTLKRQIKGRSLMVIINVLMFGEHLHDIVYFILNVQHVQHVQREFNLNSENYSILHFLVHVLPWIIMTSIVVYIQSCYNDM